MFQMTGKRRLAFSTLLAVVGCLEPIEPAPDSALSISPQIEAVSIERQAYAYSFSLPLHVRNSGTRAVMIDLFYRRTEKLVDQKWQLAAESAPTNLSRVIGPNETTLIQYVVTYQRGTSYPLLEHVRGLYRVGLRGTYQDNGLPLTPSPSYSQPFVVVDNDSGK